MPVFPAVSAFYVFDLRAKTFRPRPDLEHALAYRLSGVEADGPARACEVAFAHSNLDGPRASGYDGPSLSVGDLVEVEGEAGALALYRVATAGFARIDDPDDLLAARAARRRQPPDGGWRAPRLDLRTMEVRPGSSWSVWLAYTDEVNRRSGG